MLESEHNTGPDQAGDPDTGTGPAPKTTSATSQDAVTTGTADSGDASEPRRRAASRPAGPPASSGTSDAGPPAADESSPGAATRSAGTAKNTPAADAETAGKKSSATKTTAKKSTATKSTATKSTGSKSSATKSAGSKSDGTRSTATKSAAKKQTASKAAAQGSRADPGAAGTAAEDTAAEPTTAEHNSHQSTSDQSTSDQSTSDHSTAAEGGVAAASTTAVDSSSGSAPASETETAPDGSAGSATGGAAARKTPAKKSTSKKTPAQKSATADSTASEPATEAGTSPSDTGSTQEAPQTDPAIEAALQSAWRQKKAERTTSGADHEAAPAEASQQQSSEDTPDETRPGQSADTGEESGTDQQAGGHETGGNARRRRRRGGRRRRRGPDDQDADGASGSATDTQATSAEDGADDGAPAGQNFDDASETDSEEKAGQSDKNGDDDSSGDNGGRRRRRRRRRRGENAQSSADDPNDVVDKVRDRRQGEKSDEVSGVDGSTRVEAKRIRRREGRDSGRRRAPILSEQEFLARRESVNRKMIIRQLDEYAQIAVLEDGILVEHYVDRADSTSLIGNVYLGRVQNVLPSMEAAFVDIGRGRNAVLYAGDLDWDGLGAQGEDRKVENVLKSGQTVLVQVTKDPIGAKGARLTHHISMPGRYVVYAPAGHVSGISRKLPEEERQRLKNVLAGPVGDEASVIIRTAAEGASEDELTRDVDRLKAQWESIEKKVKSGQAPQLMYAEPDLTLRIVRDLFTEDFSELIIQGNGSMTDAYDSVEAYLNHVAPHLIDRVQRWDTETSGDLFGSYRLDEQIAKALERKVFLPSGGSLIIDRTEAMTVIDVNTGKFTGSGGNLEATVASNNLEAAEEIARQLRLRDIGGIIVIDFIDMVLPNNRELLLRRLVESLGRDRTRHQVSEVTSLGLVQMTRKRIGSGLLEAFSTQCSHCHGRGVELHDMPVADKQLADGGARNDQNRGRGSNKRRSRSRSGGKKNADGQDNSANDQSDQKNESGDGTGNDSGADSSKQEPQPA